MKPLVFSISSDYVRAQILLPTLFFLLLYIFQWFTIITSLNCCKAIITSINYCKWLDYWLDYWYDKVVTPCVEKVFDNILKVYESENKKEKAYVVFKCYKSPRFYISWLFIILTNLAGIAFVQFWNDFLLEESNICSTNPTLACFSATPSTYQQKLDCSNMSYLEENNITAVVCYKFVYQLGQATGSAVGIVSTSVIIVYLIQVVLLKISHCCKGCITVYGCITMILIQLTVALSIVGVTTVLYILQTSSSTSFDTWSPAVKTFGIGYTFATATVFFPSCAFKNINDSEIKINDGGVPSNDSEINDGYTPIP